MKLSDKMLEFVRSRKERGQYIADALDAFLETFLPDDETAAEAAFRAAWNAAAAPSAPTRPPSKAGQGRPRPNSPKDRELQGSLTAPFRFLPLNEVIAQPEAEIISAWQNGHLHDRPLTGGYCGQLTLTLTFDGPVLVAGSGDGATAGPVKIGEDPVIPGATLRGLTRATLEAAAFARLSQTNLHRRFGIRDFEHDLFTDEARKAVNAGWLRPSRAEDGVETAYVIEPCDWSPIRIRDLKGAASDSPEWHHGWLGKDLAAHYADFGMRNEKLFDFDTPRGVSLPGGGQGVLVFSGKVPAISPNGLTTDEKAELRHRDTARDRKRTLEIKALRAQDAQPAKGNSKRTEAVFAASGSGVVLPVLKAVWDTFVANNSRPSRHAPKATGNWAVLEPTLNSGRRIPVFWVGDDAHVVDFGLVRVFKRAHSARVMDVLANTAKGAHLFRDDDSFCPDFVEALFGYVHEPEDGTPSTPDQHKRRHLKSRVAFGFARLAEGAQAIERPPVTTVQAAPKPSFAPFYLSGQGRKDWSHPGVELAGRKVYPPRNADVAQVEKWLDTVPRNENPDTQSKLRFLAPASGSGKLVFTAEIRVHNVTAAELGGLIWALTLGGNDRLRHMIGRAKTAGAGQAQITVDTDGITDLRGQGLSLEAARAAFAAHMTTQVKGWESSAPLRALLHAADPGNWKGKPLNYLPLKGHRDLRKAAYAGKGPKRFLGVPTT